jgi:hypothetical protein
MKDSINYNSPTDKYLQDRRKIKSSITDNTNKIQLPESKQCAYSTT